MYLPVVWEIKRTRMKEKQCGWSSEMPRHGKRIKHTERKRNGAHGMAWHTEGGQNEMENLCFYVCCFFCHTIPYMHTYATMKAAAATTAATTHCTIYSILLCLVGFLALCLCSAMCSFLHSFVRSVRSFSSLQLVTPSSVGFFVFFWFALHVCALRVTVCNVKCSHMYTFCCCCRRPSFVVRRVSLFLAASQSHLPSVFLTRAHAYSEQFIFTFGIIFMMCVRSYFIQHRAVV